jgi:hypothetical protein
MKRLILIAAFFTALPLAAQAATPAPCENMLEQVRSALAAAKLSDAEKAKVVDLQSKGVERCKADDDAHADEFFTQALKALGK